RHQPGQVGAGGDVAALADVEVVGGQPLGDVGHGEEGDLAQALQGPAEHGPVGVDGEGQVGVREHDALGVAGRPRGVDDRDEAVGGHAGCGALEVDGSRPEQVVEGEVAVEAV